MPRSRYSLIVIWIAVLAVLLVPRLMKEEPAVSGCTLLEVIDGDTLLVVYEKETVSVRLIGVDAPESVHPTESKNSEAGEKAHDFMIKLTDGMDRVYLEFDREMYDGYGRMLAYVYPAEGVSFAESINYCLVEEGYAINREYQPNTKYAGQLERACNEARTSLRGLWAEEEIQKIWD